MRVLRMLPPRTAALLALTAGAAAVAVLVLAVAELIPAGLIAAGAVLVAVGAAWAAVTQRGTARAVAAAAVVLALAGGTAVLVLDGAVLETAAIVALLAVAVVCGTRARVAAAEPGPSPPGVRRTGRVSRGVLLMNPRAGGGKVARFDLAREARGRGVEPILLEPGDDLRRLALDAVGRGAEMLGMAGGDGSQAIVAAVAMEQGLPFACIPAGTRNHLALDLGVDREDVVGALDAYVDGVERRIDLACVGARVFVNNVSLGLYAEVVQSDRYRDAKLRTAADLLPDLAGADSAGFDLRFDGPDGAPTPPAQLVLVSNDPYRLDRLLGLGSRPRLDRGRLGIVALAVEGPAQASAFAALEAAGRVRQFPGWREWTAEAFEVRSAGDVPAGVDGEALRLAPPLRFRSLPGALRVRVAAHHPGRSPASLSAGPSVREVADLVHVALHGATAGRY